ncbi:MAG: HAMP domain-containing histidine kinase [Bryobacterales bacterium]|nr:HAMP domain-containing histidine kinase [Bryobacterales bacterium]
MLLKSLRESLFPGSAELDEGFSQEILSLSHLSLRITAFAEMLIPLAMVAVQWVVVRQSGARAVLLGQAVAVIAIGAATWCASRMEWAYERSRTLAIFSVWLVAVVLVIASLMLVTQLPGTGHYIPGRITAVMMVVVAAIPLLPMQTFALGASIGLFYFVALAVSRGRDWVPATELDLYDHAFMLVVTLISTALTAVVYHQRAARYQSYLAALQASMELRAAQSQVLLSESAASLGRLAAALSHELNTPLGVLRSAVDTLLILNGKLVHSDADGQKRLFTLQTELCRSVETSTGRLAEIVTRMQRFTNLDRAEVQSADLVELLRDVVSLHEPMFEGRARVDLQLDPLPPVACRPQQLSAVFSNLLSNAAQACDGNGLVVVSARRNGSNAEIAIRDNGRGMTAEEVAGVFDPGFRITQGRVATGNWSLFGSRQIVHDHGGEIRLSSRPGEGTTVSVTLPVAS